MNSISHGFNLQGKPLELGPWIFIQGKGGVGKTTLARALAHTLAQKGSKKILLVLNREPYQTDTKHTEVVFQTDTAFEEYATLKLKSKTLAHVLCHNDLMKYLLQAAPGISSMVYLGYQWHALSSYDHVIVDFPSTGHGLSTLESVFSWGALFTSGLMKDDIEKMKQTLLDPESCTHLLVSLAEELPLQETLDLKAQLLKRIPNARSTVLINKCWPRIKAHDVHPEDEAMNFWKRKLESEDRMLAAYSEPFLTLPFLPQFANDPIHLSKHLSDLCLSQLVVHTGGVR